jgi:hypothetical protein
MERSTVPSMDLSKPSTHTNLEAAFGGESMANRKYLFFSEVAKQLGHKDLPGQVVSRHRSARNGTRLCPLPPAAP